MSAIHPRKANAVPAQSDTFAGLLQRWLERAITNWQRRKTVAALAALDDRMLLDIGLERGALEDFADVLVERERWLASPPVERQSAPAAAETLRQAA